MYPHVVQLDARQRECARELQLVRERRQAARTPSAEALREGVFAPFLRLLRSAVQPLTGPS